MRACGGSNDLTLLARLHRAISPGTMGVSAPPRRASTAAHRHAKRAGNAPKRVLELAVGPLSADQKVRSRRTWRSAGSEPPGSCRPARVRVGWDKEVVPNGAHASAP